MKFSCHRHTCKVSLKALVEGAPRRTSNLVDGKREGKPALSRYLTEEPNMTHFETYSLLTAATVLAVMAASAI